MDDRQTVTVSRKSWHGRLYQYWRDHAKYKTYGYRENLCHYVRVVVFWAPITAFLHAHPKGKSWLRPCTVLIALAALVGLVTSLILAPGKVGIAVLIAAAFAVVIAGFVSLVYVLDEYGKDIGQWLKRRRTLRVIGSGLGWTLDRLEDLFRFFGKPLFKAWDHQVKRGYLIPVLAYAVVFALAPVQMLLITVGAAVAVGIFVGAVFLIWTLADYIRGWQRSHAKPKVERAKGDSFVKVAWQYGVARKHKICPFINLKES